MFTNRGLSLDQAPPIGVVFGFFALGLLFGIISGIEVMVFGAKVLDFTTDTAVIVVHTLSLGVMMPIMLGALFQMLPVVAGVKFQAPIATSKRTIAPLALGVILLLMGFYTNQALLFALSSLSLGVTLLSVAGVMTVKIIRLQTPQNTARGMAIALVSLIALTLSGLYLLGSYGGWLEGTLFESIKRTHIGFGTIGWIGLLIASIAFVVIEMFYVTPPYPKKFTKWFTPTVWGLLATAFVSTWITASLGYVAIAGASVGMMAFAFLTLLRLSQRKRPITDATVWFWRTAMVLLIASMSTFLLSIYRNDATYYTLGGVLFALFALSVVFAMFYKIVPFLTWFHLNAQGHFDAPMMHEIVSPKRAMGHLFIHVTLLVVWLFWIGGVALGYVAGILMIGSFGFALWQLIRAWFIYLNFNTKTPHSAA